MFDVKSDYEMVVHKLPENMEYVNLYPIADTHFGSPEFSQKKWDSWKKRVLEDEYGKVIILGDMIDNGLKNSKTDVYKATLSPLEQKKMLAEELSDIRDRILVAVDGNHEQRSVREVGSSPLYDVMAKLDLEDLFRENMAFLKVNVGFKRSDRQWSYGIVASHGASRNKVKRFVPFVDGMDVFLSGHIHDPSTNFPAKIVMDMQNEVVRLVPVIPVIVPSFADYGGYAMRALYEPTSNSHYPIIQLSGTSKEVSVHWI